MSFKITSKDIKFGRIGVRDFKKNENEKIIVIVVYIFLIKTVIPYL
jgi:hypothetical protein